MKELKCPKCGSVFSVDEADYASILSQVKNQEFEAELRRRIAELDAKHQAEQALAFTKAEQQFERRLAQKDETIVQLNAAIKQHDSNLQIALLNK